MRGWVPAIASGERLVAVAVTERDQDSDDGLWLVNGAKLWCAFARRAHPVIVHFMASNLPY